ncbi:MAG: hypothetical protein ACRDRT_17240 [Pseudonocardiaceae bacterium]
MAQTGEFPEFETDEATFNAMLEQAEPVQLVPPPACVTVPSAARDAVTFRRGLPLSVGDTASTVVGSAVEQNRVRPRSIH